MKEIAKGFGMFLAFYVVTKLVVAPAVNKAQVAVGLTNSAAPSQPMIAL